MLIIKLKNKQVLNTIFKTDFNLPGQISKYEGKVRDVYSIDDDILVVVASDRISAFDIVMPKPIPFKGQVLNQISLLLDIKK